MKRKGRIIHYMLLFYYTWYMSQVIRKYSNGKPIKLDDNQLFQREGFGAYKREDIANNLAKGLEQFIADEKMNEKDAQMFRQIVGQAIEGTRNGQFTRMDTSGIHNTMNLNSNGITEGKKFLGINVGGQRAFDKSAKTDDGRNNALNALNRYYTKTLDSMSTYNYDNELKAYNEKNPKTKYNANTFLTDEISRRWYGGNGIDWDNFSKNRTEQERLQLISDIYNNANFNELFNKYDWSGSNVKNVQDLTNLFKTFGANIANGTLDNSDYNSFAALGGTDLNQFLTGKKATETIPSNTVQGQVGKVDTTWNNPDYDRTVDDKGQYHIYKKGTGEEINGIIPGNVFEGVGNKYVFNGNIYDDSNLPEQYKQDIDRARQAQLGYYTQLTDNNPFTKMLRGQGYNYITNLSQFAPGIGNNILYGIYSNPSDVNGKMGYYLKDPTTGKAISGKVEYNNTLGQYQFIGNNGSVTNLGAYNKNGTLTNQETSFVNYNDTSKENLDKLIKAWSRNDALNNSASDAYKMVQSTLSKWIMSESSPFIYKDGQYEWKQGDTYMLARRNPNGQWSWSFNGPITQQNVQNSQSFKQSKVDLNRLKYLIDNMGRNLTQSDWEELRQLKGQRIQELRNIPESQRTQQEKDEYYNLTSFKNGGVISAQLGVKFTKVDNPSTIIEIPEASPEQKEKAKLVDTSFRKQQNINLGSLLGDKPYGENKKTVDAGGILKDADKLKLKAALVDLAGTGLGFIPGMNIASAATGVGASATNFYADLQDGFHWGDVGNLAMNLGMDALSLIPVGKSFKAVRALKTIAHMTPLILTGLNATGLADPELRASYASTLNKIKNIHKIDSLKSLNTGDIQNLNAMLGIVLGTKNLAKNYKGFWNTNTTDSGKRRVTAMIDGKQQSLEVDEAFFQNTKGKNQVQELKNKFAEQYNKQNKLEGDKAIKAENVAVDTKYFGRRPQSEKVAGTKGNGNWVTNNMVGRYFLGYEDPSVPKGLDAILLNPKLFKRSTSKAKNAKSTQDNRFNYLRSLDSNKQLTSKDIKMINAQRKSEGKEPLTQQEIDAINNRRKQTQNTSSLDQRLADYKKKKAEWTVEDAQKELAEANRRQKLAVHVQGENVETPKGVEDIIKVFNAIPTVKRPSAPISNPPAVIPKQTLNLSDVVYGSSQVPKFTGIQEGIESATKQRIARDIYNIKTQRSIQQNTETVARKQAEEAKKNVDKAITMAMIPNYKKPLQGAPYKAKQTMYNKLFNQRYYDMQDAIRNRELPHKKSNKKKKTSKDNKIKRREWGGLLFKDGGLIPKFENPAGPIRMQAKSKNYFDRNIGLSGYNFGADVDEFLKHGTVEDYIIGFNGREDNYDALVKASGGTYGNRSYISNPLATTVQSAMLTYNPGYDKYIRQNIQGYGVTEGQGTGTDTYLGDRTWERTLGRNITPEQAKYFNDTYLNQRGIELFDKGDGGYRLRLLSQVPSVNSKATTEQKSTPATTSSSTSNTGNGLIGTSNSTSKNPRSKFSLYPEDVLSLGRMVGGLVTNNRTAKLYKEGLKPTLLDTFENYVPLQGNFQAKTSGEQQAGNIQSLAAMPRTSDASLQLAGELDATDRAAQARMQGDLADAERFYQTRMLGQQESDAAKARRVEIANKNRASMNQINAAKKQIDASRLAANYQQVLAPWLAGIENKYAQNKAALKQYQLESSMNNQATAYQSELASLYDKYKDNAVEFNKQKQLLDGKYKQLILDEKKSLISSPWLINFAKSGSKLGYKEKAALQRAKDFNKRLLEDNKRFHKDIMESKREHNKLLKHMSSLTAALIKKGLNL